MKKIIQFKGIKTLCQKLHNQGKSIVLVGGCFDIFHYGHLKFLEQAKKQADILIIALENDEKVKKLKGKGRPITPFMARAEILASLCFVDYVLLLPDLADDESYSNLSGKIRPQVIAVTENDPQFVNKQKQAKAVHGRIVILPSVKTPSSSQLNKIMQEEL